MAENEKICSTCKRKITSNSGGVTFKCPKCGMTEITRCTSCRKLAVKYSCQLCNFSGP